MLRVMKNQLLAFLLLSLSTLSFAQAPDLTGKWEGVMHQDEVGSYWFTMDLVQFDDGTVTGLSALQVQNDDNAFLEKYSYGILRLKGQVKNTSFYFFDTDTLMQNLSEDFFWCIKEGLLDISSNGKEMSGPWSDPNCFPGTIELQKQ